MRCLASATTALFCCSVFMAAHAAAAAPSPGKARIPDFSGVWAHLTWPDVAPPVLGPGPVTNRSRGKDAPVVASINGTVTLGVSDPYQLVGDYTNPILKPEAASVVKRYGEISIAGLPYPTPSNQCWPGGVPFVFWNIGMQMVQQDDEINILYSNDHEVRHVRMNQPHPAVITPSWYGDSVGHYEGDTLVIDTVGIKVGPFAMVDMYGTPHTEALHVVERYRLLDYEAANEAEERGEKGNFRLQVSDTGLARNTNDKGPGLQLEFAVEDPGVFTTRWSAAIIYRRPLGEWSEMVCADSTLDQTGRKISIPQADNPDF
jgi:hypothetical protein